MKFLFRTWCLAMLPLGPTSHQANIHNTLYSFWGWNLCWVLFMLGCNMNPQTLRKSLISQEEQAHLRALTGSASLPACCQAPISFSSAKHSACSHPLRPIWRTPSTAAPSGSDHALSALDFASPSAPPCNPRFFNMVICSTREAPQLAHYVKHASAWCAHKLILKTIQNNAC